MLLEGKSDGETLVEALVWCHQIGSDVIRSVRHEADCSVCVCWQMCGAVVLGFGVYLMVNFKLATLTPSLASFSLANMLLISGIVITCVSFLGFLGALKENRCLLLTVPRTHTHTQHPWVLQPSGPSDNFLCKTIFQAMLMLFTNDWCDLYEVWVYQEDIQPKKLFFGGEVYIYLIGTICCVESSSSQDCWQCVLWILQSKFPVSGKTRICCIKKKCLKLGRNIRYLKTWTNKTTTICMSI